MHFFKVLRHCFGLISKNKKIYMESVVILQLIRSLLVFPLLSYVFYTMLSVAGVRSVTENTIIKIFQNPFAVLFVLVLALISIFFIYYEQAYYLLLVDAQQKNQPLDLRGIFRRINSKAKYFISFQSIFFLIYFVLILPIASVGMSASLIQGLRIPNFITDELMKSTTGKLLYAGVFLFILYLGLRFIFAVPFFILEKDSTIMQAAKKSWHHTRKRLGKILLGLLAIVFVFGLLMAGVTYLSFLPLRLFEAWVTVAAPVVAGITTAFLQVILFFSFGFLQALLAAMLLFLAYPESQTQKYVRKEQTGTLFFSIKRPALFGFAVIVSFVVLSIVNTYSLTETVYQPTTKIIAHRGYTSRGVENTLGALEAAAKAKADYVEMDIQETKDHQFVVFHDTTLSRLTDRNDRVSELTLAELQAIEVSSGGYTDKIPSLEEFIEKAKELDIDLLIEVKLHGGESADMEERFVKILQEQEVTTEFLVQSLDEATVTKIKELDPAIQTGFLIALNIGQLPETTADFIVLEEFSLNKKLLEQAEKENKPVFVWTVNQEQLLRQSLQMNVDGIITNYPSQAIALRDSFDQEKTFVTRVKEFLD